MAARSPSGGLFAFLIVIVLIVGGVGFGLLYEHNHPQPPASPRTVVVGDNVTVNYIGYFASGPEVGKIFDTSIQSVAENNATYPKALLYSPRNASGYTPLPVHVGPHSPKGGYSVNGVSYASVVTGFWKGLLGLPVNVTRSTSFPASEGYGPLNQSCLVTAPLVQTIPVSVSYLPATFTKSYPGVTAAAGVRFSDPTYGWADTVVSVNSTSVVVARQPTAGQTVSPYGWKIVVQTVTSRTITLASDLTPSSPGNVLGKISNQTVCQTTKFIVWSVDLSAGTFVENYNSEVVGQALTFVVTVAAIYPP